MADMHAMGDDRRGYIVVMHFDIPAGNNAVNVLLSTAFLAIQGKDDLGNNAVPTTILQDGDGIAAGTISAAEKILIEAGIRQELVKSFPIESGGVSNPELKKALREFYVQQKIRFTDKLIIQLKYVGYIESEV